MVNHRNPSETSRNSAPKLAVSGMETRTGRRSESWSVSNSVVHSHLRVISEVGDKATIRGSAVSQGRAGGIIWERRVLAGEVTRGSERVHEGTVRSTSLRAVSGVSRLPSDACTTGAAAVLLLEFRPSRRGKAGRRLGVLRWEVLRSTAQTLESSTRRGSSESARSSTRRERRPRILPGRRANRSGKHSFATGS